MGGIWAGLVFVVLRISRGLVHAACTRWFDWCLTGATPRASTKRLHLLSADRQLNNTVRTDYERRTQSALMGYRSAATTVLSFGSTTNRLCRSS